MRIANAGFVADGGPDALEALGGLGAWRFGGRRGMVSLSFAAAASYRTV